MASHDEAMCKKRKLNYTQWHVIGFVTFDKKKFTFDIWWLNSSFRVWFLRVHCLFLENGPYSCCCCCSVFFPLLIKQSNQVSAQYQYWNHPFDELDSLQRKLNSVVVLQSPQKLNLNCTILMSKWTQRFMFVHQKYLQFYIQHLHTMSELHCNPSKSFEHRTNLSCNKQCHARWNRVTFGNNMTLRPKG